MLLPRRTTLTGAGESNPVCGSRGEDILRRARCLLGVLGAGASGTVSSTCDSIGDGKESTGDTAVEGDAIMASQRSRGDRANSSGVSEAYKVGLVNLFRLLNCLLSSAFLLGIETVRSSAWRLDSCSGGS